MASSDPNAPGRLTLVHSDMQPPEESEDHAARAELLVDVDGFEGPLDLLLALARAQKVDLTHISILALSEQYLAFVEKARAVRLELAADYLVMAAWLAYLKSRLLLPQEHDEQGEPSGEELAARLAFRLQRLQAMRDAGAALTARNLLDRDVFARGSPEGIRIDKKSEFTANLYDLLNAYALRREVRAASTVRFRNLPVWSVKQARQILERLVGDAGEWQMLDSLMAQYLAPPEMRATVLASTFTASLEMVRQGALEIRQAQHFEPLFVRQAQTKLHST
ncbi:MAG: segregation and condensation protein A [Alphaproteobacteria bacterium]